MKVLMFGWEYPPHILGGLGTASYGITKGLAAQGDVEITFCLPKPWGDEDRSFLNVIAMNAVPVVYRDVNYDYVKERVGNIMDPDLYYKMRDHIYADFNYMLVNDLGCIEFSGKYQDNLHSEINNYSIVAGALHVNRSLILYMHMIGLHIRLEYMQKRLVESLCVYMFMQRILTVAVAR